jgi:hypothetical protein
MRVKRGAPQKERPERGADVVLGASPADAPRFRGEGADTVAASRRFRNFWSKKKLVRFGSRESK